MKFQPLIIALATLPLSLQAAPFAKGDAKAGEKLHKTHCVACHAARFGGDGSGIYTRPDRKVKNAAALAQQIALCNTLLATQLFPEDEANLGAYLNSTYYKFK